MIDKKPNEPQAVGRPKPRVNNLMIAAVVCGGLVVVIGLGLTWAAVHRVLGTERMTSPDAYRQHLRHGGGLANPTDDTTHTRLSGVVTQVSGSGFTLVGNGTTRIITTNSSTAYNVSANKVSANDSVLVLGTDSNGIFTATRIYVINA